VLLVSARHLRRWALRGVILKYFIITLLTVFLFEAIAYAQTQPQEKTFNDSE
jgi:hypothetical protein